MSLPKTIKWITIIFNIKNVYITKSIKTSLDTQMLNKAY